jgi:hypothetical protein
VVDTQIVADEVVLEVAVPFARTVTGVGGYIGKEGSTPMLQFGGVQVAIIAAPPPDAVAVAGKLILLPVPQLVPPTPTDPGAEEHQFKKLPLMTLFRVSVTVATMFVLVLMATET